MDLLPASFLNGKFDQFLLALVRDQRITCLLAGVSLVDAPISVHFRGVWERHLQIWAVF